MMGTELCLTRSWWVRYYLLRLALYDEVFFRLRRGLHHLVEQIIELVFVNLHVVYSTTAHVSSKRVDIHR